MKKIILVLAVFAAIGFTSCNKEKDCVCTSTFMGTSTVGPEFTIDDGDCSDGNSSTSGIVTKCEEQ